MRRAGETLSSRRPSPDREKSCPAVERLELFGRDTEIENPVIEGTTGRVLPSWREKSPRELIAASVHGAANVFWRVFSGPPTESRRFPTCRIARLPACEC